MLQHSKAFDFVFLFMLFGMFMLTVLIGGVLALIAHLVGGPLWLVIAVWATPPVVGLGFFLRIKLKMKTFLG